MTVDESVREILEALELPVEAGNFSVPTVDNLMVDLSSYMSEELAKKKWSQWYPEQASRIDDDIFAKSIQRMLSDGLALGFKPSRFREIAGKLPVPTKNARNWIPFFEETVNHNSIRVYLNKDDYYDWVTSSDKKIGNTLGELVDIMADGLFYDLGIVFPAFRFEVDPTLGIPYFRIEWNDFRLPPQLGIPPGQIMVDDTVESIALRKIVGKEITNPANGSRCTLIPAEYRRIVIEAGLKVWDPEDYLVLALGAKLKRNAASFVNRTFVDLLLYKLKPFFSETVAMARSKFERDFLVQILRGLLFEQISVRNLQPILDKLLSIRSLTQIESSRFIVFDVCGGAIFSNKDSIYDATPQDYVEAIRQNLKRYVTHKYARGRNSLSVFLLDRAIESRIELNSELSDYERDSFLASLSDELRRHPADSAQPVILTSADVRYDLYKITRTKFPNLVVLSYQELSPDINIQPIARIESGW